ncbi:metallophosphoesterase [Leptospira santarosai]|uniref:Phosphohydrolase n=1 Tax=Leptospira santarosai serovar Shermani str. LT 821 TaxID=758847 RepID=K8Y480_9LEPT|nr:metallophosphoesterase [Leptospira santarosai]EKS09577.1 calcineurin-like phosphoesterase family protein [Leptospira santarosai str. JET]EKT87801.1 phosphohydrolase [Leptospira santarosai serovar Shermani str. LT 821]EPG84403.1 calcineurin-like phosphoesterase family protein [Leptospira santarosai serovar Shermani str. 1342KT]MDI7202198.1 metallophosphoesterase [Leptospira santarosai]
MENQISRFLIFLSVFTLVIGLGYSYAGFRLIPSLSTQSWISWLAWTLIFLCTLSIPVSYYVSLTSKHEGIQTTFSYLAFTGLGFFTILFSLVLLKDITSISLYWFAKFLPNSDPTSGAGELVERKEFLNRLLSFSVLGLAGGLTGIGFYQAHRNLKVISVDVFEENLHPSLDGFRIVQISDIHIGPTIKKRFLESVVRTVNELKPDLVAITGDLVDGPVNKLARHITPLADLESEYGTFFVTGNHEYYSGVLSWIHELKKHNIQVLLNENKILKRGKANLTLAGVTDLKAGSILPEHKTDPYGAMKGGEKTDYKILLAHQPNSVFEGADAGFDLQLSGHTHGGQYFPGNLLIYLAQKFVAGLHKHKDTWIYVSRGTGYWGPPIRLGAPSEISLIRLKKNS